MLVLLGLNRLVLAGAFSNHGKTPVHWSAGLGRFGWETLNAFFLAGFLAFCVTAMLKILKIVPGEPGAFGEMMRLGLRAQSPYFFAGPAAIAIIRASQWLGGDSLIRLSQLVSGALPIATFFTLYALLRKRYATLGELSILTLTLSPCLILIGAVFAGLAALFMMIAAIIVAVLLSS